MTQPAAQPSFLFVELAAEHANQAQLLARAADLLRNANIEVLAHAPPGRVACLEPGTVGSGILLARTLDAAHATRVAKDSLIPMLRDALPAASSPTVLRVAGLPENGLPDMLDIPTVASVPRAPSVPRNALMIIRGSVIVPAQIDRYRDVILPMLKERGGYYEVFALAEGETVALAGEWREQIFAVSRWPTRAAAEDFWYCDRYQQHAIPLRLGGGRFSVHLLDAHVSS